VRHPRAPGVRQKLAQPARAGETQHSNPRAPQVRHKARAPTLRLLRTCATKAPPTRYPKTNFGSYSTPCFFKSAKNSASKLIFW